MKSFSLLLEEAKKKVAMNKKGVFGLTSVQAFFAIILGIAILAYVIVVIMGTLTTTTILADANGLIANESGGWLNSSGYRVHTNATTTSGFNSPAIVSLINSSNASAQLIPSTEYTVDSSGLVTSLLGNNWTNVNFSYTYLYDGEVEVQSKNILRNTSLGVTGFFNSVNPVYAILAILVIILVLIVLVRVVAGRGGEFGSRPGTAPQL